MVRKVTCLAICLTGIILGCEKKAPEPAPAPPVVKRPVAAPAGMAPVGESRSVFIAQTPLTVGQYVTYLKGTGQAIPSMHEGVEPESPRAGEPVMGLSRAEAARCATWHLRRLPTPQEWQEAAEVVGPRPYPWLDDGAATAAEAEIFLVRDWAAGSEAAARAREAKEGLRKGVLAEHAESLDQLRRKLQQMIESRYAFQSEQWKQLKPAFFSLLEKEKKLAELAARRESRAEVVEVLGRLAIEKGKLAATLKTADLTPEEEDAARDAYESKLAEVRAKTQEVREELRQSVQAQQQEVLDLTRLIEEQGTAEAAVGLQEAEAALEEGAAAPKDAAEAARMAAALEEAMGGLQGAIPAFEGMPSLEQIDERAGMLDQQ
ncbi:MAG: SUMF1/EgtB/PvdO family nonheme iron enzyme, partial [Planctomycetota bacterium]